MKYDIDYSPHLRPFPLGGFKKGDLIIIDGPHSIINTSTIPLGIDIPSETIEETFILGELIRHD